VISPYSGPGGLQLWITPGGMLQMYLKTEDTLHRYDDFIPIGM
jgi:hypothetical protein